MTEADVAPAAVLAAQLVRQHHAFDARRFFVTPDVEDGYRWFFGTQLEEKNVVLLVAELDGALAGYVYGTVEGRDWALLLDKHGAVHDVFVDARFRRRGVAKALMEAALVALKAKGAPQVVLYSAAPNAEAQALFERLGFRRTMVEMTKELS